ncbi:MAG: PIN domain-containing protein [Planctomycetes bacterium]|jgi:predicted nucleic acid-binding protein|nr:PIN domain-containing protein [Planctomycetota bacterium]
MAAVILDTGCIVALVDRREQYHPQCVKAMTALSEPPITCEAVIVECLYLLRHLDGAAEAILEDVAKGLYQLPYVLAARAAEVSRLMKKYADVPMDLADACLVDLATQMGTGRILTLDGDFKIYRWGKNRPFELLIEF